MPFPERLLNDGEVVVVDVRPHVWALAGPFALAVVCLAAAGVGAAVGVPAAVGWVLVGLLALALVHLVGRYVRWRSTSLVVTDDRLIRRSGVLARRGREIPLTRLTDISYRRSVFQRVIGAGDLILESAGRDSEEIFASLPHPESIQNEIYRLMSARQGVGRQGVGDQGAGGTQVRPVSLPEQLEQLADLRRQGVLSDAEFVSAKTRLLQGG